MNGYLLDTSSLSLLAPGRTPLPAEIGDGLRRRSELLCLPTIAIAEIRAGICKLHRTGGGPRGEVLDRWLTTLVATFSERVLPFDAAAAGRAGELSDAAVAVGRHPGFADVAIAGIALSNRLTVVSENKRHFLAFNIDVVELADLA